jgi:protein tyrosine/serine phosphatase
VRKTHRFLPTCALTIAVALCPAIGSAGPKTLTVTTSTGSRASVAIDNFGQVNERYYRGSQPQGRDYQDLAALGVKTVINLTSDDTDPVEQAMVEKAGMSYLQIPMTTHVPPTAEQLSEFLAAANDPARQPVYVHCVGGKHRTGVMTAVYRMTHDAWSAEQAFKEMKQYKFGADFLHAEFKRFVYGFVAAARRAVTT